MKLYGTPPTRAIRAIWLINELGLDCEIVTVDMGADEHLSPPLLALNPAGKLPFLVDDGAVISESCAIQLYLAETYSAGDLMPTNLAERGQVYRWMFFLATDIEQPLWRIALHTAMYAEGERSDAEVPLAARDCKAMLAVLENHMTDREFIASDTLSVADFNAAYTLDWAREAGLLGEFQVLNAYVERMYDRPAAPPTIEAAFKALNEEIAKAQEKTNG